LINKIHSFFKSLNLEISGSFIDVTPKEFNLKISSSIAFISSLIVNLISKSSLEITSFTSGIKDLKRSEERR
jgi:hypothetical protein